MLAYGNPSHFRLRKVAWYTSTTIASRIRPWVTNPGGDVGCHSEPCGFAAALGRRCSVAHKLHVPTTAKRDTNVTKKRSGLLTDALLWSCVLVHRSVPPFLRTETRFPRDRPFAFTPCCFGISRQQLSRYSPDPSGFAASIAPLTGLDNGNLLRREQRAIEASV